MGENNITPFQGAVKIPNEIRDVKDSIIFGLSGKQILCSGASIVIIILVTLLLRGKLNVSLGLSISIGALLASPLFAFGFVSPGGIPFEDWVMLQYSNTVKSAPVRKLRAENAYEKVQKAGERKMKEDKEKEERKKGKIKKKEKPEKKKTPKSKYSIRK